MVSSAQQLLSSFDALEPSEQVIVVRGILSRLKMREDCEGEITEEDLTYMADEVFQMMDEAERRNGTSETW